MRLFRVSFSAFPSTRFSLHFNVSISRAEGKKGNTLRVVLFWELAGYQCFATNRTSRIMFGLVIMLLEYQKDLNCEFG